MAAFHCSAAETCHLDAIKINRKRVTFWLFVCKNSFFVIAAGSGLQEYTTILDSIPMPFNAYSHDLSMQLLGYWTRLQTITGPDYTVGAFQGIVTSSPTMDREIFALSWIHSKFHRRVVNVAWPSSILYAP